MTHSLPLTQWIRREARKKGLRNVVQIAGAIGMSESRAWQLLKGAHKPQNERCQRIADLFNVPVQTVYGLRDLQWPFKAPWLDVTKKRVTDVLMPTWKYPRAKFLKAEPLPSKNGDEVWWLFHWETWAVHRTARPGLAKHFTTVQRGEDYPWMKDGVLNPGDICEIGGPVRVMTMLRPLEAGQPDPNEWSGVLSVLSREANEIENGTSNRPEQNPA